MEELRQRGLLSEARREGERRGIPLATLARNPLWWQRSAGRGCARFIFVMGGLFVLGLLMIRYGRREREGGLALAGLIAVVFNGLALGFMAYDEGFPYVDSLMPHDHPAFVMDSD